MNIEQSQYNSNEKCAKNATHALGSLVCVGAVAGAFGVRGEVKVKTFTQNPQDVTAYGPLYDEGGGLVLTPKSARPIKGGMAVRAPEVTSREAAQALKSTRLYVPKSALPPPGEDEFYYSDLTGLRVEDETGTALGRIKAVHDFGAGDVLEILPLKGPSWFHPFSREAVPMVDIKGGRIVVADVPGVEAEKEPGADKTGADKTGADGDESSPSAGGQ